MTMTPPTIAMLIDELPEDFALIGCNGNKVPIDHLTGNAAYGWTSKPVCREELKRSQHVAAIGVITGSQSGGVLAIDFDGEDGEKSFQKLTGRPSAALPITIANTSGKPSRKKLFLSVSDFSIHEFITGIGANSREYPALEILWDGRQAIIIGEHPETEGYYYLDGCSPAEISKPAEAPDWLISPLLFTEIDSISSSLPASADIETLQVVVSHLNPEDFITYWPWLKLGMALKMADPSAEAKNVWINFCKKLLNFDEKEINRKWKSFKTSDEWAKKFPNRRPLSIATVIQMAMANGYKPKANSIAAQVLEGNKKEHQEDIQKQAQLRATGKNLLDFIRCLNIRWNELKRHPEMDGKTIEPKMAYLILADKYGIEAKQEICKNIFIKVAQENSYNPVFEYFNGLRNQDLPLVSDDQIKDAFGIDEKDLRSVALLRLHLRACANRGMNPGCKLDSLLIFQGVQGDSKSGAIEALTPNSTWYDETTHNNFDSKDALSAFNSSFIHEFSEIEKLTMTRDVAEFKSWITRKFDKYVEKYETVTTDHPRRCCLFGTTNQKQFLNDPTGSRRFLVCETVKKQNLKLIKEIRDSLWRQSLMELESGLPYYLNNNDVLAIANSQRGAIATHMDPWEDIFIDKIGGLVIGSRVKSSSLMSYVEVKGERQHTGHYKRIAGIMQRLGWVKKKWRDVIGPVNGFEKVSEPPELIEDEEPIDCDKYF